MATYEEEFDSVVQYPLDPNSYKILEEIGVGVNAMVCRALCLPLDSALVAIKFISLRRSRVDSDDLQANPLCWLSHPNILNVHCSFPVDDILWVVMPFMAYGSVQSIISHSFEDGLREHCISVILKEILNALVYLHGQGQVHRDIKASNILIDINGLVKLAFSASIYQSICAPGESSSSPSSSSPMHTDVAENYWMAPEIIHSHTGYSFEADIWSFGITALELAHGRPPLSHRTPSESMTLNIVKHLRFPDLDENRRGKVKKFTNAFKDMVASCLEQDPSKRPTAEKLLQHSCFDCSTFDIMAMHMLLEGLPTIEERYGEIKIKNGSDEDEEGDPLRENVRQRRISSWSFNEDRLLLDPVFPAEPSSDTIVRQVQLSGGMEEPNPNVAEDSMAMGIPGGVQIVPGASSRASMLNKLTFVKKGLEIQLRKVKAMMNRMRGEEVEHIEVVDKEEQLTREIDKLKSELEDERENSLQLELQMGMMKLVFSCVGTNSD